MVLSKIVDEDGVYKAYTMALPKIKCSLNQDGWSIFMDPNLPSSRFRTP